jgi:CheY-like chemotaxis protein
MSLITQILLVEDDSTAVELVREAFKDSGIPHDLTVASDGAAALEYVQTTPEKPHLILLDINLPKKSGLEVLKEIKQDPKLRTIPVIMLTNSRSQDDVVKAYNLYCNAYVRKPLGFDMIVETIKATGKFWFDIATLPDVSSVKSKPPLTSLIPDE